MVENYALELLKSNKQSLLSTIDTKKKLNDIGYDGYLKELPQYEKKINDLKTAIKILEKELTNTVKK